MEFEKILKLIESVSNSELTSFTLEEDGTKLVLEAKRGTKEAENTSVITAIKESFTHNNNQDNNVLNATQDRKNKSKRLVKSPLVGTFYSAPSPEASPYVCVGDKVSKGQTLGIVEAMKLMNEIEADYEGIVTEILIENGAVVELDQPLFVIE